MNQLTKRTAPEWSTAFHEQKRTRLPLPPPKSLTCLGRRILDEAPVGRSVLDAEIGCGLLELLFSHSGKDKSFLCHGAFRNDDHSRSNRAVASAPPIESGNT